MARLQQARDTVHQGSSGTVHLASRAAALLQQRRTGQADRVEPPRASVPGIVRYLQETDSSEAAIGLAEQWLAAQSDDDSGEEHVRDMTLVTSKAYCNLADQSLRSQNIEQAFESLQAAKQILANAEPTHPLLGELLPSAQEMLVLVQLHEEQHRNVHGPFAVTISL
jgi:hypothetical protein